MPLDKMIAGQEGFLKSTKFCTPWATELAKKELPKVLDKINLLKGFFNEDSINK